MPRLAQGKRGISVFAANADRASRSAGDRISCDTLVMWGQRGVVQALFDPLTLWQAQCKAKVRGLAMLAGHFMPEELPAETAAALHGFFGAS